MRRRQAKKLIGSLRTTGRAQSALARVSGKQWSRIVMRFGELAPVVDIASVATIDLREVGDTDVLTALAAEQLAKATRPAMRSFRRLALLLTALSLGMPNETEQ